jgi:predicted outer membrane repeat protein
LIAAIYSANANPALSIIHLSPGCVYTLTDAEITIEEFFDGSTFNYGSVGLPPIISLVTIDGQNATITRSAGSPNFRILHVTNKGSLTVNDLTISHGVADASMPDGTESYFPGSGGGIYNAGVLTVNRCVLESNQADSSGGGLFTISAADTTVNGSSINENTAALGAGIFVYGNGALRVSDSNLLRNNAITEGGGINVAYGSGLVIQRSTISYNHSGRRGGAVFKDGGANHVATTISGSTFEGNLADWGGGAVFIWRTPLNIGTSTFLRNQATEYGGGLVFQSSGSDSVIIRSSSFERNEAGMDGGGLHFSGENLNIINSTFLHNRARNGGGIHQAAISEPTYISRADSTLMVTRSTFKENAVDGEGGGIYNEGSITANLSDFTGNEAGGSGGGIANPGILAVEETTFARNKSKQSGGGIYSDGTTALVRSTLVYNSAIQGGGLAVNGGETALQNDTFSENSADTMGGGISANGSGSSVGDVQASFITLAYNMAVRGGGIAVYGGTMKIKNSIAAYSPAGGDCSSGPGAFNTAGANISSDGSCIGFTLKEDPRLDVLAANGGSTLTHALKIDSPAIDAAPDCTNLFGAAVAVDQRSLPRPVGPFCDLGAYEFQQLLPAPSIPTTTPTLTMTVTATAEKPTDTPVPPSITAIKNANCRYGPGMLYEIADTLMKGQTALVVGRNEENTWWQIKGPRFGTLCWVAHTTVEESGPMEGVPIGVAPPEPTLYPELETKTGCYVFGVTGEKQCVVPCPLNVKTGGPCSP